MNERNCTATGAPEEDWINKFKTQIAPPLFRFKVGLRRQRAETKKAATI